MISMRVSHWWVHWLLIACALVTGLSGTVLKMRGEFLDSSLAFISATVLLLVGVALLFHDLHQERKRASR